MHRVWDALESDEAPFVLIDVDPGDITGGPSDEHVLTVAVARLFGVCLARVVCASGLIFYAISFQKIRSKMT